MFLKNDKFFSLIDIHSTGSQVGPILPARRCLAVSGDIFSSHNWGREGCKKLPLASSEQRPRSGLNIRQCTGNSSPPKTSSGPKCPPDQVRTTLKYSHWLEGLYSRNVRLICKCICNHRMRITILLAKCPWKFIHHREVKYDLYIKWCHTQAEE